MVWIARVLVRIAAFTRAAGGYTVCITALETAAIPIPRKLAAAAWLLLAVAAVSLVGALTSLNEDVRHGVHGSFALIWLAWLRTALMLACFGVLLWWGLGRWPRLLASATGILGGYLLAMLLALPLQMLFLLRTLLPWLTDIDPYTSLLHWSYVTAVYAGVVAWRLWQQARQREQAAFELRLALERQRALALRAQLEPHFVFNALNAISALVRSNQGLALHGIERLSGLLQYALAAGERDWVSLADELEFIDDYLALQRLRHGARLRIAIDGADGEVLGCDCPPLLLQPLIENALRHDLEMHDGASDIVVTLARQAECLQIQVSNRRHPDAAPNPGAGLGLKHIAARLLLAYGGRARLEVAPQDGRYDVTIWMPCHAT